MKKKINIGVKRSAFCVRQTVFALIAAVGIFSAADVWGTDKSATPPVASCTASESIAVDSRMGGLSTVAPKSVSYSSCWCGEKNIDNYVVIDTVLHGGMFNEEIVASVTNRTAGNAEYAEGSISIGVPGEVRCVRLTHRVYDKDGVEIGEALIRDVAFGVASTPSTAAFADSRTNSLQVAVDAGGAFDLTYDTQWGTNVASLTIAAVKLDGDSATTNTILDVNAYAVGVKRLAGVGSGLWRYYCTLYGAAGEIIGTPLVAGYFRKPAFLMLIR